MSELVKVDFHGDLIEAVRDEEGVWAAIRRPCESLGLSTNGQIEKLKTKPWAVHKMILSTATDGVQYQMFALHLDSWPMWLATIDSNRAKKTSPEKAAKLELYQKRCARVLRDHFFGQQQTAVAVPTDQSAFFAWPTAHR